MTNIHTLLHFLLKDATLFFVFSSPCYVEGFFFVIASMFSGPLELATLALGTLYMVIATIIP
jgi:hypothetical protein